jgi:hypothetical protein
MITTISEHDSINAFKQSDTRKDQFSYEALKALYEYYNQLEDDLGEQIEFDMISICCEWTEYETFEEIQEVYTDINDLEDLRDNTTVIPLKSVFDCSGYLVQNY